MEERRIIPQDEIVDAANRIARHLSSVGNFNQATQAPEVVVFARYALAVRDGEQTLVDPMDLLRVDEVQKLRLAQERIRQLMSPWALDPKPERFSRSFSSGLREVLDFLGAGNTSKLNRAVEGLSDVERELFYSVAPVSILEEMSFPDLDSCPPAHLARYIRGAAFEPNVSNRDDTLETLITAAVVRSNQNTLNLAEVAEILFKLGQSSITFFNRLIESAQWGEFRDGLIILFESCHDTAHLADRIREQMDHEDIFIDKPPRYRVSADR